jgi:hypothetical protein
LGDAHSPWSEFVGKDFLDARDGCDLISVSTVISKATSSAYATSICDSRQDVSSDNIGDFMC